MKIAMGLIDIPEKQEQIPYDVDFIKDGNLLYIASAGYGKTVFLTTAVLSLAMQNSVQDLNFYIFGFRKQWSDAIKQTFSCGRLYCI